MSLTSKIWVGVRILFTLFMIMGGVQHFLKPDFYLPFIPGFLPFPMTIIYVSGFVEIALGLLLLFKKYSKIAAVGIFLLMLLFLPVHVWDIITDTPAIGSHKAALIRLAFQFLFLAIAWKIKQVSSLISQ
ncbi:DoxX family membrane protein [Ancylomarina euxinus]|uniref:DoxX family membrane protein n=1 Tax=Ancylomarina euxinus TaxID=2283627 RepID=A0A425Y2G9_9BACT|nr:DoxX family membrane protein [Ancylomarina euxinus]MCZ4694997.1 DoxX family membrane protein [Ancylomarina euxinus]MUP14862.1 DoxX family membrane protein [Ancylomarina euxinus]RRG22205.1 DoxX family membrane protein [Ancylomarina euxinus]